MKHLSGYWLSNVDNNFTNVGDILTPFIFNKYNIKLFYDDKNPQIYGIGSLLHMIPNEFIGYIWTTGFMYPTRQLLLKNSPLAVRGYLSKKQFINDTSNTAVGDGGLLLERIYKPKIRSSIRYTLGIMPNYCDIINMRDDPIEEYDVFNHPDVIFIDPRNYIDTVINDIYSCDNILSSSLHGLVIADSYGINNSCFYSRETNIAIHSMQDSFKFKDYYSIFDTEFRKDKILPLNKNTSFEECLTSVKTFNKPNIEQVKYHLEKTFDFITNMT